LNIKSEIKNNLLASFTLLIVCAIILPVIVSGSVNITSNYERNFVTNERDSSLNNEFFSIQDSPNSSVLEDFLDASMDSLFDSYNLKGATVSIVKGDEILLTKGYGYRNSVSLVDPNQSLFRIGSISKTFTAIAVLQLVEDGLLDLDEDVNTYLSSFQLPATFDSPITLRHLLTHTAGFEESHNATIVYYLSHLPSLEDFAPHAIPTRVYEPGYISAYSNYGLSLAGYIVQEISGKDFNQYVEDEILSPLGMNFTTFRQPIPTALSAYSAVGYDAYGFANSFEYVTQAPAGACSSSAKDMAKLMIALLNDGFYNGTQILNSTSIQLMQDPQFQPHPNLPFNGFGLYQMAPNSVRVIGHGGDLSFFHSLMALLPDEDFGFFVSFNSYEGMYAREVLFNSFIQTFYPYSATAEPMEDSVKNLNDFVGLYLTSRRHYQDTTFTYYTPLEQTVEILETDYLAQAHEIVKGDDSLILFGHYEFVQVAPDYFVEKSGLYDFELAFIRNDIGEITHFYGNLFTSLFAMERLHPFYTDQFDVLLIVDYIVLGLFLLALVWWFIDFLLQFKKKQRDPFLIDLPKLFPLGAVLLTLTTLAISSRIMDINLLTYNELSTSYAGPKILASMTFVFFAAMFVYSILTWVGVGTKEQKPYWKIWDRIFYSILTLISIPLIVLFPLLQIF